MAGEKRGPVKRGWKKDVKPTSSERAGPQRGWRKESTIAVTEAKVGWSKRKKFGLLWGGIFLILLAIILVILWLIPPKPVALILVGAGYEDNLAVAPNVYGWQGLRDLAEFARGEKGGLWSKSGPLSLKHDPLKLNHDVHWDSALGNCSEKTVLVFFALHGGNDAQGPYLLMQDADLRDDGREDYVIRLRSVISRLNELPDKKNKVLILDATQVPSDWGRGVLHNDFARGLKALAPEIDKVPNLVVLSASDENQRSWVSDEWRQTAFSHYVIEGLKGAADKDRRGRITAWDLHQYVSDNVEKWARDNREARQTPLLHGGDDRAKNLELCAVGDYKPSNPDVPPFQPSEQLASAWKGYHELQSQVPPPWVYSPAQWQVYQESLLRYEQLVLAGETEVAPTRRKGLDALRDELERDRRKDLASAQNTLAMPAALALPGPNDRDLDDKVKELWDAKPEERKPKVQEWEERSGERSGRLLRGLAGRVLERASAVPKDDLRRAYELLPVLGSAGNQRPAEVHFMAMLYKNLGEQKPGNDDLSQALRLRVLAENAALAVDVDRTTGKARGREYPYSEQVLPWVKKKIERADRERQLGQDLLFATQPEYWSQARQNLKSAWEHYLDAEADARSVREALAARDEVFALLPAYSRWLAGRRTADEARLVQVEDLWERTHKLARQLETVNADDPKPGELTKPTQDVRDRFKTIRDQFEADCQELAAGRLAERQGLWYQINEALVVPSMDPDLRLKLLRDMRGISAKLHAESVQRFTGAQAISEQQNLEAARDRARRQGRMCLALLGERWFDDEVNAKDRKDTYKDVLNRIRQLTTDPNWDKSLAMAGEEIGVRWRRLPIKVNGITDDSRGLPLGDAAIQLRDAERLERLADGAVALRLTANHPADEARKLRLHDLLLWQAERTLQDHWFAEGLPDPYYQVTGLRFVQDAHDLVAGNANELSAAKQRARLAQVTEHEAALRKKGDLVPDPQPQIDLTSEPRVSVRYVLRPNPQGWVPAGYAVAWAKTEKLLQPPKNAGRQVLEVSEKQAAAPVLLDLVPEPEATKSRVPKVDRTTVALDGFYRGQVIHEPTPVLLHRSPQAVWTQPATDKLPAAIAVQTEQSVFDRFSPNNGAVAIVLDCSGSMRDGFKGRDTDLLQRDSECRFKQALDSLEEVLAELPKDTTVSVCIFAQSGPEGARTIPDVERTIEMIRPPSKWSGARAELRALMDELRPPAIQPWNETPLVRALWKAKEKGFPKGFNGFKTVIALTDGIDNRFDQDRDLQDLHAAKLKGLSPEKKIAKFIEEEFQDSGVQINLVGFQVEEGEKRFRDQFEIIERKQLGKIYLANNRGKLVGDLKKAIKREMRFYLESEDAAERSAAARERFDKGWEIRPTFRAAQWAIVAPGHHVVRVHADRTLRQNVRLEAGECLLLTLRSTGEGLRFERALMGEADPKAVERDDWLLACHENKRRKDGAAQLLLTLEKRPDKSLGRQDTIAQVKPRTVWLEVGVQGGERVPPLRWGHQPGYWAPAFSALLPNWLADPTMPGDRPAVTAWANWQDDPRYYARDFDRNADVESFFSKPENRDIQVKDARNKVAIESVHLEVHDDVPYDPEALPGVATLNKELCLVVRLRYTKGYPVWADLVGLNVQGREHRFYTEAGKYTGIFWPVTRGDVQQKLQSIHVMPVDEFKNQETTRKFDLRLDLPDPGANRPDPVFRGQGTEVNP
jgi:hypothetical protein